MKFQVLVALIGLAKAIQLSDETLAQHEANEMEHSCKEVADVKVVDKDELQQLIQQDEVENHQDQDEEEDQDEDDQDDDELVQLEEGSKLSKVRSVKKNPNIASDHIKHYKKTEK